MQKKNGTHKSNFIANKSTLVVNVVMIQLIALFARIPLTRVIGDEGNGIYSATFELYTMILLCTLSCMPEAIAKTIAARTARGQYKNAIRVFRISLLWNLLVGMLICFLFVFGAEYLADKVMLVSMSAISIKMLGPAAILMGLVVTLRGYFQGMGTTMPSSVSKMLDQIVSAIASIIASLLLCNYGIKVAHLLHNNSFAAAYAVMGISVGSVIGLTVALIFLLLVFAMYKQQRRKQMEKDTTKASESNRIIIYSLLYTLVPIILIACIYNISTILDQIIYNHIMTQNGQTASQVVNYGIYSGKYKVIIWIPIAIASMMWIPIVPALNAAYERVDMRLIRNKVAAVYRLTMIIVLPLAVGLTILARPILNMFFRGDVTLAYQLIREGTVAIVLIAYASVGNAVLQGMNKIKIVTINNLIAMTVHIISLILLLKDLNIGIHAVVFANIIMAFLTCCLNYVALRKFIKFKPEWIRTFVIPLIASGMVGLVAFIIHKLLEGTIGNTAAVLLAFIIGLIVYTILIVLGKAVNEKEILSMPLGRLLLKIAKLTHVI